MWGSLAAAFLAAGSRNVAATLYSVKDSISAKFSALFYHYGGDRDPAAAAAKAQRDMSGKQAVSAWSAFIVIGE
jgi:CHAT domain-containing protein